MPSGRIVSFDLRKLFGFIQRCGTQERFFFHLSDIRLDSLGRQMPYAVTGTEVDFDLSGNRATSVKPFQPFNDGVDLEQHRETSTVVKWNSRECLGYAERSSGDWLGFSAADIITDGVHSLDIGSQILHGIRFWNFDPRNPRFRSIDPKRVVQATEIEIYVREEPKIEIVAPPTNILAPELRNKKLRDLIKHVA